MGQEQAQLLAKTAVSADTTPTRTAAAVVAVAVWTGAAAGSPPWLRPLTLTPTLWCPPAVPPPLPLGLPLGRRPLRVPLSVPLPLPMPRRRLTPMPPALPRTRRHGLLSPLPLRQPMTLRRTPLGLLLLRRPALVQPLPRPPALGLTRGLSGSWRRGTRSEPAYARAHGRRATTKTTR